MIPGLAEEAPAAMANHLKLTGFWRSSVAIVDKHPVGAGPHPNLPELNNLLKTRFASEITNFNTRSSPKLAVAIQKIACGADKSEKYCNPRISPCMSPLPVLYLGPQ